MRIGPGARWTDVAAALGAARLGAELAATTAASASAGSPPPAGSAGSAREHGLTIDHLRAVEVVLADGSVVRASADENPDLFWAVRGAGANFGIVTSFEFEVDEVGEVGSAQFVFDAADAAEFLRRLGRSVEAAPRDLTTVPDHGAAAAGASRRSRSCTAWSTPTTPTRSSPACSRSPSSRPLCQQSVQLAPYAGVMGTRPGRAARRRASRSSRSGLIEHITPEFAAAAGTAARIRRRVLLPDPLGRRRGRRRRRRRHRVRPPVGELLGDRDRVPTSGPPRRRCGRTVAAHFDGLYLSFETDQRPSGSPTPSRRATLARLRELKARYDPDNVFRDNFAVEPVDSAAA